MHATYRRIKVQPGKAAEVAALIEAEYLPLEARAGEVLVSHLVVRRRGPARAKGPLR